MAPQKMEKTLAKLAFNPSPNILSNAMATSQNRLLEIRQNFLKKLPVFVSFLINWRLFSLYFQFSLLKIWCIYNVHMYVPFNKDCIQITLKKKPYIHKYIFHGSSVVSHYDWIIEFDWISFLPLIKAGSEPFL